MEREEEEGKRHGTNPSCLEKASNKTHPRFMKKWVLLVSHGFGEKEDCDRNGRGK